MLLTDLAFRSYYQTDLGGAVRSELQIMELLKTVMLRMLHTVLV
jgi:hypothetical protein